MNRDELLSETARIIRTTLCCGPVEITRQTKASEVRGWDSLSHTIILLQLEEGFGIQLPIERVLSVANVGELVDLIAEMKFGT